MNELVNQEKTRLQSALRSVQRARIVDEPGRGPGAAAAPGHHGGLHGDARGAAVRHPGKRHAGGFLVVPQGARLSRGFPARTHHQGAPLVQGNVTQVDFWLFHKALGYHEGFQHAHTIKVLRWSQEDTYLLDLVDDRGRRFHIELIFPELERDLGADWKRWNEYKAENREMFERIDAQLLAEHIEIAENWE